MKRETIVNLVLVAVLIIIVIIVIVKARNTPKKNRRVSSNRNSMRNVVSEVSSSKTNVSTISSGSGTQRQKGGWKVMVNY